MAARIESVHPVLMSSNVAASILFFGRIGFALAFADSEDDPKYAGVRRGGVELHLQWHDAEQWSHPGDRPTYRFLVDDVDALLQEFQGVGVLPDHAEVRETPWGTREFHVFDPDGNGLQFDQDR
ncbi:glyoxalase superfamily protein [Tautonia sociabilis]|uniref:Glyoxalase/bleomycin resistance/extradiol dioxygenase family protein n=1 Tax=Tautonia sociabilis TaxID=2080755 RepID=A0A432MQL3_9BACT|nr:glyoxalase superfamily protein [Tautonia sociabilis]RUL89650.1 glyoxalase/bleomycin resistance/extradiol dioxygenase family protein [Tautonia sociabilis]